MEASNDTTSPTNYSYTETFTHELTSYEFTPNKNYNIYIFISTFTRNISDVYSVIFLY